MLDRSVILFTPISITLQPITAINYAWYHWKAHAVFFHLTSELVQENHVENLHGQKSMILIKRFLFTTGW